MSSLLEVRGLCAGVKKDGITHKILDNISFSVDEGEILGIAGESGCGKSMTALSIANLLPKAVKITDGDILFNGLSLLNAGTEEITVIFQDVRQALNPLIKAGKQIMEVLELKEKKEQANLRVIPRLKKIKEQKEKYRETALEMLSSLGFSNREKVFNAYPHQLSGGMCQRIMTAIAAIGNPKLLIGDEPSSSLDEESQMRSLSCLMEMNKKLKTTLILISHDLSLIQKYCTRFIVMYSGKVTEEGKASHLFSSFHPYTRALVEAIPDREKKGKKLVSIPGKVPSIEDRIQGCPFTPRCQKAQNICKENFPPAKETQNGKVYCFFPHDTKETDNA